MNDKDVIGLVDYCADHVVHFSAWPVEFECTNGAVLGMAEYMPVLMAKAPAIVRTLVLMEAENERLREVLREISSHRFSIIEPNGERSLKRRM